MLLVKHGNLHLADKSVLSDADILMRDGRIVQIGKGLNADAKVIDATGKEVFPGFIIPVTCVGVTDYSNMKQGDANEISSPLNAGLHVRYALDTREVALQRYWLSGVTSFGAAPGTGAVLSGRMGVYHITGRHPAEMCVCDTVALKGNFTADVKQTFGAKGVMPMTRMGMAALLRGALEEARAWQENPEKPHHTANAVLGSVLRKELPLLMNVNTTGDIAAVLAIAQEFDIRVILHNAYEAHLAQDLLAQTKTPVLMGDLFGAGAAVYYGTDVQTVFGLRAQGVPVAISCSGDGGLAGREPLLWNACKLVRHGFDPEDVLSMMTLETARILGVDDKIGSIAPGLFGDLVIYNGNPLRTYSANVAATIVAGNVIYEKEAGETC